MQVAVHALPSGGLIVITRWHAASLPNGWQRVPVGSARYLESGLVQ